MEVSGESDFTRLLQMEEEYIQKICADVIAVKPDLVITEKGLSGEGKLKGGALDHRQWYMLSYR